MGRGPALHTAHGRSIGAFANSEKREPDDEQRADRAQHVALPRAAVRWLHSALGGVERAGNHEYVDRSPQVPRSAEEQKIAVDHRFCSSTRSTNCSGPMRIAAPVGHARTHAGPPSMPTQASHFTAFLPFSFAAALGS